MLVHIQFHLFCRSKLNQGHLRRDIVKDNRNRHVHLTVLYGTVDDISPHVGALIELDNGIDIGHFIPKARGCRLGNDSVRVDPASTAGFDPLQVRGQAPWANRSRIEDVLATTLAALNHEFMALGSIPILLTNSIGDGKGFVVSSYDCCLPRMSDTCSLRIPPFPSTKASSQLGT